MKAVILSLALITSFNSNASTCNPVKAVENFYSDSRTGTTVLVAGPFNGVYNVRSYGPNSVACIAQARVTEACEVVPVTAANCWHEDDHQD